MILENHTEQLALWGAEQGKSDQLSQKAAHEIRGAGFFSLILR